MSYDKKKKQVVTDAYMDGVKINEEGGGGFWAGNIKTFGQ